MIKSVIRFIGVMLLYSFFAYSTHTALLLIAKIWFDISWWLIILSPLISCYMAFPVFYVFRNHLPSGFLYFDKKDGIYGDERWKNTIGKEWRLKDNFRTAWAWSVRRNPVDNFWRWFKATQKGVEIIKVKGEHNTYGDWRDNVYVPCQIKTNNNNFGDTFSPKDSKLGWLFVVYKKDRKVMFNYSKAIEKKEGVFIEWEIGYNSERYLLNRNRKILKR